MPPHDLRLPGAGPAEIIIDNNTCQLAYLQPAPGNMTLARLYSVGIGREGFTLAPDSRFVIRDKKIWPRWTPPLEMRERELRENGRILPEYMEGGPDNPLGARALYLHKAKGGDSGYRIHGTSEPQTIGTQVSSGCIRLMNEDVIDLYDRVPLGIGVTVIDTRLTRSMKTAAAPLALR